MPNEVSLILNDLCNKANPHVEIKLKALDKIINGFKKNNVELTVPNVINALNCLGISMSASSIYNKKVRGEPNPYRILFDAWLNNINNFKLSKNIKNPPSVDFITMTDSDFASIGNDVVKFKVEMLFNELKSARHQINMLKQIQNLPTITENGSSLVFQRDIDPKKPITTKEGKNSNNKSDEKLIHIKVLESFLYDNNKLKYDEDGCLVAKTMIRKDDLLSDINFKNAMIASLNALLHEN